MMKRTFTSLNSFQGFLIRSFLNLSIFTEASRLFFLVFGGLTSVNLRDNENCSISSLPASKRRKSFDFLRSFFKKQMALKITQ